MTENQLERLPLFVHLTELRRRIIWIALIWFAAFVACYSVAPQLFQLLAKPLMYAAGGRIRLIGTSPQELFTTYLEVSLWAGLGLAFPFIAWHVWKFFSPALYSHEKNAAKPYLIASPVLFIAGCAVVYFLVVPAILRFFLSLDMVSAPGIVPIRTEPRVSEYLSLLLSLMLAFGLSFQLPIVMALLGKIGLITSERLRKARRGVVVLIFIVAAVLTPPDVISQLTLAIPLLGLYEVSILCVKQIELRKQGL